MRRFGEVKTLLSHPATTAIDGFVSVGRGYATLGSDQLLRCWDDAGTLLASKKAGSGGMIRLRAIASRPSGDAIVTGGSKLTFYDPATAKPVGKCKGHGASSEITAIAFLGDGRRFATAARVNRANKANGVRLWDDAGEPLAAYLLESPLRKAPCEAHELAGAPSSDTLFALAYSRIGAADTIGPGWYVHRISPDDGGVERIVDLSGRHDPLASVVVTGLTASDDHVAVSMYTTFRDEGDPYPKESFAELRVYDHQGELVGRVATDRKPTVDSFTFGRLAASPDGSCLAVIGHGLELRHLPSLEVLDTRADAFAKHLTFENGSLLYATYTDLHRVAVE